MNNLQVPDWGIWVMLVGLAVFLVLLVRYFRKNHGLNRPLFSSPYTLWMIAFTILPCILIGYYAFTDVNSHFTLDNFKNFWDSNYDMNKELIALGFNPADMGFARGTVNVDTLVYSLSSA